MECLNCLRDTGKNGHADVFDENILRGCCTTLHTIEHNDIGTSFHCQSCVVIGTRAANLDVNRLFPIGDFTDFHDLDFKIVRSCPVRVTTGRALVDPLRQVTHHRHTIRDFLAKQHAAAAGLCALTDDHLDGVRTTQIIGVHAVAGRKILINQRFGMAALFLGHAAVTGCRRGACSRCAASKGFLGGAGQCAKAHAGNCHRDIKMNWFFCKPRS